MATIFQCINKKKSNVHCCLKQCYHNYDGICTDDYVMDKYINSSYVLLEDCDFGVDEYWESIIN